MKWIIAPVIVIVIIATCILLYPIFQPSDDLSMKAQAHLPSKQEDVLQNYFKAIEKGEWGVLPSFLSGEALYHESKQAQNLEYFNSTARLEGINIKKVITAKEYTVADINLIFYRNESQDIATNKKIRVYFKENEDGYKIFNIKKPVPQLPENERKLEEKKGEPLEAVDAFLNALQDGDDRVIFNYLSGDLHERFKLSQSFKDGQLLFSLEFKDLKLTEVGSSNNISLVEAKYSTPGNSSQIVLFELLKNEEWLIADMHIVEGGT